MKERILALLLASMLVACSAPADNNDDTTAADTTTAETTAEETTAPPEYIAPAVNYDGRKITIASFHYDGGYEILNYHVALHEENGDPMNDAVVKRNRAVEEELGVVIDIFPLDKNDRSNTNKIRTQILAQEASFDFGLQMAVGLSSLFTAENMLIDLKTIDTLELSHSWWNQQANEEYTLFGKQLSAVGDISLLNMGAPVVTYFAKDLIKDNNLEDPYQLVDDGKWTMDKMMEMANAAAKDVNGDGKREELVDTYGFAGEQGSLIMMMICGGARLSERDTSGNIRLAIDTEETVNMVEKLVPFFNNKNVSLIDGMLAKKYTSSFTEVFIPKLMENELLFYENQLLVALNLRTMESDFGILPLPKYDESQDGYLSFPNAAFSDNLIVPTTCQDTDMIGHVVESMGYYSSLYVKDQFIDQTVKFKSIRDEKSAANVEMILNNMVFDVGYLFNWGSYRGIFGTLVKNNDIGYASAYAAVKEAAETKLAETVTFLKGES